MNNTVYIFIGSFLLIKFLYINLSFILLHKYTESNNKLLTTYYIYIIATSFALSNFLLTD